MPRMGLQVRVGDRCHEDWFRSKRGPAFCSGGF